MTKPKQPRGGKIDFTIPDMFPLIESGAKCVTIRKHRKVPLEVGGILKVYLGNRYQGGQRYLGTAEILSLQDIIIHFNDSEKSCYVKIDDEFIKLSDNELRELFIKDGFNSLYSFLDFHKPIVTQVPLVKQLITFGNQSWLK